MLKNGDLMYLFHEKVSYMVPYQEKGCLSSHKGMVRFPAGLEFGDKLVSNTDEPFFVLKPTMADYMMKVKRKTTIIYPKEAGTILLELGIQSGTKLIEIGTGSGSLTLLLSKLIGEHGRIYSFERREDHLENAKKNVEKFSGVDNVVYTLKDPAHEPDGFGLTDMDAIFIDVPAPWTLIKAAHAALANGSHCGVLSPNIEQIQTTAEKMADIGFTRIRCMEILTRGIRIKKNLTRPFDRMIGHTAYLLFAQKIKGQQAMIAPEYSI